MIPEIKSIVSKDGYNIACLFNNQQILTINFYDWLNYRAPGKQILSKLLNREIFDTVECNGITLFWPGLASMIQEDGSVEKCDYEIDPVVLYEYATRSAYSHF